MTRPFVLINSNTARPPVSPVGLEYVGEAMENAGIPIEVVDLSWQADWRAALGKSLSRADPIAVGITFRNIDECSFVTRRVFAPWITELVSHVKKLTDAPLVLGGAGFSVAPVPIVKTCGADYGIAGDGEETAVLLAQCLEKKEHAGLSNLVYRDGERFISMRRKEVDVRRMPAFRRRLFDNARYQAMGAMVGIETKRGCPQPCIYCADPVSKGRKLRLRPPEVVVSEIKSLVEQGVTWYHLCDSEFNIPLEHAKDVCQALIRNKLGDRIRWYTYCAPLPFDRELAMLMKRAGCAGINFGIDSLCDEQLKRLARYHRVSDVKQLLDIMRTEDMNIIFDLLLGGPGETVETVQVAADNTRRLNVPLTGISIGIRVYPGTPAARWLVRKSVCTHESILDLNTPAFYVSPDLGGDPDGTVREAFKDGPRVLLLSRPEDKTSYNYVGDEWLAQAIEKGARGAYWDIIQRMGKAG